MLGPRSCSTPTPPVVRLAGWAGWLGVPVVLWVIAFFRDPERNTPREDNRVVAPADGRVIHAAGGSEAQELAWTLAVATAYLRAFEAGSTPLDTARRWIAFKLAADADQFLTIAKFRALRKFGRGLAKCSPVRARSGRRVA